MKLPYKESSIFFVPLRDGGYAPGVVARASPKGKVLWGFFFGPRLARPDASAVDDLRPDRAVLRVRFGDLGLIKSKWPVVGNVQNWNRSEWRMPDFVTRDPLGLVKPTLIRRADDDPNRIEAKYQIDDDSGMPADSLSGCGAVEIKLTKLLR